MKEVSLKSFFSHFFACSTPLMKLHKATNLGRMTSWSKYTTLEKFSLYGKADRNEGYEWTRLRIGSLSLVLFPEGLFPVVPQHLLLLFGLNLLTPHPLTGHLILVHSRLVQDLPLLLDFNCRIGTLLERKRLTHWEDLYFRARGKLVSEGPGLEGCCSCGNLSLLTYHFLEVLSAWICLQIGQKCSFFSWFLWWSFRRFGLGLYQSRILENQLTSLYPTSKSYQWLIRDEKAGVFLLMRPTKWRWSLDFLKFRSQK